MAELPKGSAAGKAYVEENAPPLVAWYGMPNWRLSREWLNAHPHLLTSQVAGALLRAAGTARGRGEQESADDLALHAQLLDNALHLGIDVAYRALIGPDAFQDTAAPSETALMTQIREWMNTTHWAESRAYLEAHLALISTESDALIRETYHQLHDEDERATFREHLSLLRLVREHGIAGGYQRFMLER
ncbi:MAG TPA: hypothetical protein VF808_16060 [Ktedonobacterales bacterium]